MIEVLPFGAFRNRQPLAYAPIARRLAGDVTLVSDPSQARLVLISHHKDLELFGSDLWRMLAARPGLRLVLLSEEPMWDTCWAPDPFSRYQSFMTAAGPLPYAVLNHQTSAMWRADRIPYFLLTDPRYIAHYRPLFDRNAGMRASDWLAQFRNAALDAAFLSEKRTLPRHSPAWPAQEIWGLSVYRSIFTRRCKGDSLLRAGRGWTEAPPRQDLPDWHADKLAQLDLRCRYISSFENTHQRDYVSEKIFDAFAAGGVPLYFAAPDHAVHRLVGAGGWLNFFARAPEAPVFDACTPVSLADAAAYAATQTRLARLFADPGAAEAELDRFAAALLAELGRLLQ